MIKNIRPAAILIELLLFIAFVGVTAGFILSIIIYVSIQDANLEIANLVEDTGSRIITSLTQQVRQGEQIVFPSAGSSDTKLQVIMFDDDQHPMTFTEADDALYFGTVDNLEALFSTASVVASNTFIENISNATSESVRISFTLTAAAGARGVGYTQDFSTVIHLYEDNVINQDCSCSPMSCNGSFYEWGYCDPGLTACNTFVSTVACSIVNEVFVTATTNAAEPSTNGVFTISLTSTNTTGSPITVGYSILGTALENNIDYNTLASTNFVPDGSAGVEAGVDIPNGQASVAIPITVVDDLLEEGNETITIELSTVSGIEYTIDTGNDTAVLNVLDDDASTATSGSCVDGWWEYGTTWYESSATCESAKGSICIVAACAITPDTGGGGGSSSSSSSISSASSSSVSTSPDCVDGIYMVPCLDPGGEWYPDETACNASCGTPCAVALLCPVAAPL